MITNATKELRIALIGPKGTGKSSLCNQFIRGRKLSSEFQLENIYRKEMTLDGSRVMFIIIDISSQDSLENTTNLIKQASGYILLIDITSLPTLRQAVEIRSTILAIKSCVSVPMVLIGNKIDMEEHREIKYEKALKQAFEWNINYYEISTSQKIDLEKPFTVCARLIQQELSRPRQDNSCCVCIVY